MQKGGIREMSQSNRQAERLGWNRSGPEMLGVCKAFSGTLGRPLPPAGGGDGVELGC